jgi:hypothetical protein
MNRRLLTVLLTAPIFALSGQLAKAQAPHEIRTEKNKAVSLTNFVNPPANCSSNPGPVPLPRLREKPSHGAVGLQVISVDIPATDACPARKIPSVSLFYAPSRDFVGKDSVQVELEFETKLPSLSFLITVQDTADGR